MKTETSRHPIIGYRQWHWESERRRLLGFYRDTPWKRGTTIARCWKGFWAIGRRRHHAPDPDCSCGLYAYSRAKDLGYFDGSERVVSGAIALEGRVCVHRSGLRGQRAQIVLLAYAPNQRSLVEEIAAHYGVPAVPTEKLRQAALLFGIEAVTRA